MDGLPGPRHLRAAAEQLLRPSQPVALALHERSSYYDDPARDIRIVVGYDRCSCIGGHPGWRDVSYPPPGQDDTVPPSTWDVYGEDPIYRICHGAPYDSLLFAAGTNAQNGVLLPGMQIVHGPGTFARPLIPVRKVGAVLEGSMIDPQWDVHCSRAPSRTRPNDAVERLI